MIALVNDEQPTYDSARTRSYTERCKLLSDNGYAIWDVLASCTRPGSLDSKIVKGTEQPNDIASLAKKHPELTRIVCNGRTAETLFKRHISKSLPRPIYFDEAKIATSKITASNNAQSEIATSKVAEFEYKEIPTNAVRLLSLPSTSPAMASLTLADKYQVWADGLLG
jgi:hypoxanthine-DNA glycosylase